MVRGREWPAQRSGRTVDNYQRHVELSRWSPPLKELGVWAYVKTDLQQPTGTVNQLDDYIDGHNAKNGSFDANYHFDR